MWWTSLRSHCRSYFYPVLRSTYFLSMVHLSPIVISLEPGCQLGSNRIFWNLARSHLARHHLLSDEFLKELMDTLSRFIQFTIMRLADGRASQVILKSTMREVWTWPCNSFLVWQIPYSDVNISCCLNNIKLAELLIQSSVFNAIHLNKVLWPARQCPACR